MELLALLQLVQDGSKVIAVQKEKKVEEAGVTRKKRNYVMYESKLGTEKETDYTKIAAKKMRAPKPRVEEKIVQKRKVKEYLDNYQYHETKEINKGRPDVVIHERLGDIVGGVYEETTVQKVRGGSVDRNRGGSSSSTVRENRSTSSGLRGPSSSSVTATKTKTSVTKVGRRGGAGGAFGTTTTSTSEMSTTRGGGLSSTATRTRSTQQRY